MFRKEPSPVPEPCPFHPAPFTFTYNRGSHDCVYPPSRAESCTDDSRLLLRYMACPDSKSWFALLRGRKARPDIWLDRYHKYRGGTQSLQMRTRTDVSSTKHSMATKACRI
ncbi:unnamed protein product [Leptidea sinapis]|nr:unnamed protein product [Leptidea sinapis]